MTNARSKSRLLHWGANMNASTPDTRALSGAATSHQRVIAALWSIALLSCSGIASATPSAPERSQIRSHSYSLPLTFEANQGQTDARVDFLARGENYTLFLTPTEAVFAFSRPVGATPVPAAQRNLSEGPAPRSYREVMRMRLVNSAPDARVQGLEQLPGTVNYLRGDGAHQGPINVPTYKRVKYAAVYPGIDLIYFGQSRRLEYDFIVSPDADPSAIRLAFAGVDDIAIDAHGDLVLETGGESLRFHKPILYQLAGGHRRIIDGSYVRVTPNEIGFRAGAYDRAEPLIIDPVLSYSTHLGGSADDVAAGIAVDDTGAAYVTGTTVSTDFPTVNPLQPMHGGFNGDTFVAKLTPDGTALVYATYIGGSGYDAARAIAVDLTGAAYITGYSDSPDFPSVHALPPEFCEPEDDFRTYDAFVAKLAADGSHLIYSSCLGGSAEDFGWAIAVDGSGAAYVGGLAFSSDFPTANAFQSACQPPGQDDVFPPCQHAFLAKFTPDGTALAYSTYLGASGPAEITGVTVDFSGAAYVAGNTGSPLQPVQVGLPQGESGAFVAKLAPDGKSLVYATYLGTSASARGIAIDEGLAAYVIGNASRGFPTVNALQPVYGGSGDAFVAKLAAKSGSLIYATFLGGSNVDQGFGIAADASGAAYVTGWTSSTDLPTAIVGPGGSVDAFVAKLRPDGAGLAYYTRLGGSMGERGVAIAVDLTGAAYVTGFTYSADFPTKQPLQAPGSSGIIADAFITKFEPTAPLPGHVVFSPTAADFPAQLRDIKFGEAVAIRNGIAFVGIPKAADGGHVALLNLTVSGWKRVGTIKLPASVAHNIGETEFGRVLTWRDGVLMVGGNKAAYYFSRSNGTWTFRDVVRPQFLSPGSAFPVALRYEGNDADIAGSPGLHGVGTLLASEFAAPCCASRVHIFHLSPTRRSFLYAGFVQPSDSRAGDNFGADLSMTSREFVVGSPHGSRSLIAGLPAYDQSGAAYRFRRGPDGRWKQFQKLVPSEPAPGFGTAVAIDNDMIIVGAPKLGVEGAPAGPATADGHTAGGAAYVFLPDVGRYVQAGKLRPRADELFQYQDFGYRIAMFGSRVAIGAAKPYAPDGLFPFGLVVAYTRNGTTLLPHGIAQGHVVAASMALANNWLLLGVPYERSCPSACVGSAHLYDMNRLQR